MSDEIRREQISNELAEYIDAAIVRMFEQIRELQFIEEIRKCGDAATGERRTGNFWLDR